MKLLLSSINWKEILILVRVNNKSDFQNKVYINGLPCFHLLYPLRRLFFTIVVIDQFVRFRQMQRVCGVDVLSKFSSTFATVNLRPQCIDLNQHYSNNEPLYIHRSISWREPFSYFLIFPFSSSARTILNAANTAATSYIHVISQELDAIRISPLELYMYHQNLNCIRIF